MAIQSLDRNIKIHGNGTSIWGPSKGTFVVGRMELNDFCEGGPYELQLFSPLGKLKNGQNTEWHHYTDKQIEKEVNKHFLPIVREHYPEYRIRRIAWSEQGMQPDGGWSFDVIANNDEVNKIKGTYR